MAEVLGGIVAKARSALTDGIDFVLAIIGSGASASVVEVVKSWFPEQTEGISDETLAAVVSFLIFYFGDRIHRRLTPFGLGMFLASVGAWSAEYTASIFEMFKKK